MPMSAAGTQLDMSKKVGRAYWVVAFTKHDRVTMDPQKRGGD